MARHRRSIRKNDRSGLLWTAVQADSDPVTPTGIDGMPLIIMLDDFNVGTGQTHATFMRARGWIDVCALPTPPGVTPFQYNFPVYLAAFKQTSYSGATIEPGTVANYTEEDVLWTGGSQMSGFQPVVTTAATFQTTCRFEIDIKAKRKLESGDAIALYFSVDPNAVGVNPQPCRFSGVIRSLLKMR